MIFWSNCWLHWGGSSHCADVKVGGFEKILPSSPVRTRITRSGLFGRIFFTPPTLMAGSSAVLWPTKTHSTSLERSKPPLLTQILFKSLAALLVYFISVQSTLISIGFISKGAVFVGPICIAHLPRFYLVMVVPGAVMISFYVPSAENDEKTIPETVPTY